MPLTPLVAALTFAPAGPGWFTEHLSWIVGAVVVVLGLFVLGLADLKRFVPRRVSAIAGVCFDESIRRRVLWIIPLAVLGLVAVDLLQRPTDAQDAIRQATKFCLMATGLVVVVSTAILACTNLPREIENRVIFTVVTKPTTRLEIVVGKIVGFALVSGTILLIMGSFTFGYLHLRAWYLERSIRAALTAGTVQPISRPSFEHYASAGLLNAKSLVEPIAMSVYEREPDLANHRRYPASDGYVLIPFTMPADTVASDDPDGKYYKGPGMIVHLTLGYDPTTPVARKGIGGKPGVVPPPAPVKVSISIFDRLGQALVSPTEAGDPNGIVVPSADGTAELTLDVPSSAAARAATAGSVVLAVATSGGDGAYWINDDPDKPAAMLEVPILLPNNGGARVDKVRPSNPNNPDRPPALTYIGREGTFGQVIKGASDTDPGGLGGRQTCVLSFRGADVHPADTGPGATVPIEFRSGIEKASESVTEDALTDVDVRFVNLKSGTATPPVIFQPENNRTLFASVPAAAVAGGNFDVVLRCRSNDQWVAFRQSSLEVVGAQSTFGLNLVKSLLVLWLLAIFVTTVAIFTSTFLSWPIAVVLTFLVLFGHWGVDALGDATAAGVGRSIASDLKLESAPVIEVVSTGVEQLNKLLKVTAAVLPDVGKFSATDDIQRGITVPWRALLDASGVLVVFGLPLTTLAYVIFKNKEVAP